MIELYALK